MTPNARFLLVLAAFLSLGSACTYHVLTPPARAFNMESAAPVKPRETVLGGRTGVMGGIFEPGAVIGTAGVRHGVAPNVELNGELTFARIQDNDENTRSVDRNAGATRIGVKAGNEFVAVTGGLGGGFAAIGNFGSVDLGGIVSMHNCYLVPFVSASGIASASLSDNNVVAFEDGRTSRPGPTVGFGAGVGLEFPLSRARCREGRTPPRLQLGANTATLWGRHTSIDGPGLTPVTAWEKHGYVGAALGLEVPIDL
jgi:hypothetical protein